MFDPLAVKGKIKMLHQVSLLFSYVYTIHIYVYYFCIYKFIFIYTNYMYEYGRTPHTCLVRRHTRLHTNPHAIRGVTPVELKTVEHLCTQLGQGTWIRTPRKDLRGLFHSIGMHHLIGYVRTELLSISLTNCSKNEVGINLEGPCVTNQLACVCMLCHFTYANCILCIHIH